MELFKVKSNIDERANALTYQISTVGTIFAGHLANNYYLTYDEHLSKIKELGLNK